MPASDEQQPIPGEVFARFQAGDPDAMDVIVQHLHPPLVSFLRSTCRQAELAEDIAQESFLAAWRQRTEIREPARLRAWLFTVARRLMQRAVTRPHRRAETAVDQQFLEVVSPAVEGGQQSALRRADWRQCIDRALAALGETDRELVTLRYFGELSIRELSETLQLPMGTVGVKLQRALEKARRELERQGITPEELLT